MSSEEARGLQHPTTVMNANDKHEVSAQNDNSTGPAKAAAVSRELFLGIDVADARHVVTRFVPGEGVEPAEGMTGETLVKRAGKLLKEGVRVHCVYEAGPTGFALARRLMALGVSCLVVRPHKLERYGRRRMTDPRDSRQLAEDLAHHHAGRRGLLLPVRIPSVEEELRRLPVRERQTLAVSPACVPARTPRGLAGGRAPSTNMAAPGCVSGARKRSGDYISFSPATKASCGPAGSSSKPTRVARSRSPSPWPDAFWWTGGGCAPAASTPPHAV